MTVPLSKRHVVLYSLDRNLVNSITWAGVSAVAYTTERVRVWMALVMSALPSFGKDLSILMDPWRLMP